MKTLHNNKGFALLAIMGIFLMLGIAASQLTTSDYLKHQGISYKGEPQTILLPVECEDLVTNIGEYMFWPVWGGEYTVLLQYLQESKPGYVIVAAMNCPVFLGVSMGDGSGVAKYWKYVNGEPWPCSEEEFVALVFIEDDPCVKPKTI